MAKIEIGDPAPYFDLAGTGGKRYRLADQRGRWTILAFYPGDFTLVCTRQFCSYRDDDERLAQLDADVLGISPQSVESHDRFTAEHGLSVPLLADPDRATAKAYGVLAPGGLVRRSIFIVDPDGILRHRDVSMLGLRYRDADDLAEALARAREG
jgi:thioredoxin-dependent peroxiredoxin